MVLMDPTDDDRRWAEAEAMAAGVDDPARRRSRRNRVFLFLVAVIVLSWVTGIVVVLALPHGAGARGGDGDISDARAIVALAVEGVGVVVMIAGFIWAVRAGRYIVRWRSIASPLSRRQRRQAQQAIAGKAALEPDRTRYLLALAVQNRRTTEGITPLYGGILLINSVSFLLNPAPYTAVFSLIVVVLFAVAAVQLALVYRRSGRFLAAHE